MDAQPPSDPTWIDFFKYSIIALVTSIAVGRPWADPKTGDFSGQQLTQSVAACIVFGIGTAGAQTKFQQPFWITGSFAAVLAMIGLPAIVATAKSVWAIFARTKLGVDNGKAD
jgi:hypothetical protein